MKLRHKYLIYLSLVFLVVALYDADYLRIPEVLSGRVLVVSFLFLFAGFISDVISLKQILKKSNYHAALNDCLAGVGLSVFGKYIPGKIWMVVGSAAYISEKTHYPLGKLSAITLRAQLILLWIGLVFGATGLFLLGGPHLWWWLILFLWLVLTVVLFSKLAHDCAERLIRIALRKEIEIPRLSIKSTVSVMPWFTLPWLLWSIGFYMLVVSLVGMDIPWSVGLGFPFAATLGIMALVVPGGLGAREAVMVGYLALAGIPLAEATTVALASRLWFSVGEVFIFNVGWLAKKNDMMLSAKTR